MKIAITGGTGFVGSHLDRALALLGHQVVIVTRQQFGKSALLADALKGCDSVAHCVGINREADGQTYEGVHVEGTRRVVQAAKEMEVGRIVLLSYLRARPGTRFSYFESKWQSEELVRSSGIDYSIFKAAMIFGDKDQMLHHLSSSLRRVPLFASVGMNEKPIRPVAVEDVVSIIQRALIDNLFSNQTVPIVGPEEMKLSVAVRRVSNAIGRKVFIFPMPVAFHYLFAWIGERVMRTPVVTVAQVRMLAEGISEPLPGSPSVPDNLAPKIHMDEARIRQCLVQ